MGRTVKRVLASGSIAFLLGLMAVAGAAAPAAADAVSKPAVPLPASPDAFADRAAAHSAGVTDWGASARSAGELIVLAAACAIAVAVYSAISGSRGTERVPVRIRRR